MMELCGKGHKFCSDCCWGVCRSAISDGLVPACAFDKAEGCGAVSETRAARALSLWLKPKGQMAGRKTELASWAVRGSHAAGYTSGRVSDVYNNAKFAAAGAVQCIGKNCKAHYVPDRQPYTKYWRVLRSEPHARWRPASTQHDAFDTRPSLTRRIHSDWSASCQHLLCPGHPA